MNIYVEIFGYIGTVFVIVSMMMTSLVRLRAINICGGMISLLYSCYYGAWAMVVMNACLITINIVQIIIALRGRGSYHYCSVGFDEAAVSVFMSTHASDIGRYSPALESLVYSGAQVNMIYSTGEAAGIVVTEQDGDQLRLLGEYTVPKHRSVATGRFLLESLKGQGAGEVFATPVSEKQEKHLLKLGFEKKERQFIISL